MKLKTPIAVLSGITIGIAIVAAAFAPRLSLFATQNKIDENGFLNLISELNSGAIFDWSEYRKGDWHVAVAWTHDTNKHEAVIYAFAKNKNSWRLVETEKLSYSQDRLDHVLVNYPDRNVMLVNDQGLLIHSILLGASNLAINPGIEEK